MNNWYRVLAGVLLLSVASCAQLAYRPMELSPEAVLLPIGVVPQDELYECGLASLSALCSYHQVAIPDEEREQLVAIAEHEQGLSGTELREALERAGMEVFIFPGRLDRSVAGLYYHIDLQRPLLVMISPGKDANHYCLVTGYDPTNDTILLLDPRRGVLVLPSQAFESLWASAEHFTLLCLPSAPQSNELSSLSQGS